MATKAFISPAQCICRPLRASAAPSSQRRTASTSTRATSSSASSSSTAGPRSRRPSPRDLQWSNTASCGPFQQSRRFTSSPVARAKDPYNVLGVGKDASSSEIKRSYYQLAKKFHPDSNKEKSAKEKFVEIQEAYDILSDDKKRADFDRFGSASTQQGFDSDAYARASSSFGGAGFGDFFNGGGQAQGSDIFESLFGGAFRGGGGGQARQAQSNPIGEDIELTISVPFIDAAKGTTRSVQTSPVVDCHTCHGSGMKQGVKKTQCGVCRGTGTRTFVIQSGFQMASTCNACAGTGSLAPEGSECAPCAGVGKVRERKTVEVKIPQGVDSGMRIRMDGKGDAPLQGKGRPGNLFVRVNVQPSKVFTRQGSNLYEDVAIPFYTAILGGRARVATLDQDVEVKVPNGTQPGEEMVLRGRGVKKLYKEEYGDLVVKFNLSMPRSLTAAQRRILEQFVSETEFPGSSDYAPQKPKAKPAPPEAPVPPVTPTEPEASPVSPSESTAAPQASEEATASPEHLPSSTPPPPPSSTSNSPVEEVAETKGKEARSLLGDLWQGVRKWLPKK